MQIYSTQFEQGSTCACVCAHVFLHTSTSEQTQKTACMMAENQSASVHVCDSTKWPSSSLWNRPPAAFSKPSRKAPRKKEMKADREPETN